MNHNRNPFSIFVFCIMHFLFQRNHFLDNDILTINNEDIQPLPAPQSPLYFKRRKFIFLKPKIISVKNFYYEFKCLSLRIFISIKKKCPQSSSGMVVQKDFYIFSRCTLTRLWRWSLGAWSPTQTTRAATNALGSNLNKGRRQG